MLSDTKAIHSVVASIIEEMIGELELDYDQPIESHTRLIADLGFASVDFVHLIVQVETRFKRKMGFHDLIMPNGSYVDDLSVGQFVAFIQSSGSNGNNASATRAKVLDDRSPPIAAHAEASSGRSRRILRSHAFSGKMGRTGERSDEAQSSDGFCALRSALGLHFIQGDSGGESAAFRTTGTTSSLLRQHGAKAPGAR